MAKSNQEPNDAVGQTPADLAVLGRMPVVVGPNSAAPQPYYRSAAANRWRTEHGLPAIFKATAAAGRAVEVNNSVYCSNNGLLAVVREVSDFLALDEKKALCFLLEEPEVLPLLGRELLDDLRARGVSNARLSFFKDALRVVALAARPTGLTIDTDFLLDPSADDANAPRRFSCVVAPATDEHVRDLAYFDRVSLGKVIDESVSAYYAGREKEAPIPKRTGGQTPGTKPR
jgi:hypothetical protein